MADHDRHTAVGRGSTIRQPVHPTRVPTVRSADSRPRRSAFAMTSDVIGNGAGVRRCSRDMKRLIAAAAAVLVLSGASTALAGGFATVGLDSIPSRVAAGAPGAVGITVLQHGVPPLADLQPAVLIASGERSARFAAVPAGRPGAYRAKVVFPAAGRWSVTVDDGFVHAQHTFPAIQVGPRPARRLEEPGVSGGWLVGGILA